MPETPDRFEQAADRVVTYVARNAAERDFVASIVLNGTMTSEFVR